MFTLVPILVALSQASALARTAMPSAHVAGRIACPAADLQRLAILSPAGLNGYVHRQPRDTGPAVAVWYWERSRRLAAAVELLPTQQHCSPSDGLSIRSGAVSGGRANALITVNAAAPITAADRLRLTDAAGNTATALPLLTDGSSGMLVALAIDAPQALLSSSLIGVSLLDCDGRLRRMRTVANLGGGLPAGLVLAQSTGMQPVQVFNPNTSHLWVRLIPAPSRRWSDGSGGTPKVVEIPPRQSLLAGLLTGAGTLAQGEPVYLEEQPMAILGRSPITSGPVPVPAGSAISLPGLAPAKVTFASAFDSYGAPVRLPSRPPQEGPPVSAWSPFHILAEPSRFGAITLQLRTADGRSYSETVTHVPERWEPFGTFAGLRQIPASTLCVAFQDAVKPCPPPGQAWDKSVRKAAENDARKGQIRVRPAAVRILTLTYYTQFRCNPLILGVLRRSSLATAWYL